MAKITVIEDEDNAALPNLEEYSNSTFLIRDLSQVTEAKAKAKSEQLPDRRKQTLNPHHKRDSTIFLQNLYLRPNESTKTKSLPEDAREILRSQPNDEDLLAVLRYLQYGIDHQHEFNIRQTNAQSAQILQILVTTTLADQWQGWLRSSARKGEVAHEMCVSCLTSLGGIGALTAQCRGLNSETAQGQSELLNDTIDVLSRVLRPSNIISVLMDNLSDDQIDPLQKHRVWQETCTLIGGSKLLGAVMTAVSRPRQYSVSLQSSARWLSDGSEYTKWLAVRLASSLMQTVPGSDEAFRLLAQLLKRGLGLGYRGRGLALCNTISC